MSRPALIVMIVAVALAAGAVYYLYLSPEARRSEPAPAETPARQPEAAPVAADPQGRTPGLYMTIETSMGAIPCKLFENEAPITVGKIVGLATGRITWLDPRTGQPVAGRNFYDGLTFHRVIPNFMIQGGDPKGDGTGGPEGPGFPFEDEIHPRLKFDVPGRLAMANSGPRTNRSQFFITEVPTPHLDGRHTIFGDCSGLSVVRQIARVPVGSNGRPRTPVRIERVVIERVGPKPPNAPEG